MNCAFGFVPDTGGERFTLVRIAVTPVQRGPAYPVDYRKKLIYCLGTYQSLLCAGHGDAEGIWGLPGRGGLRTP